MKKILSVFLFMAFCLCLTARADMVARNRETNFEIIYLLRPTGKVAKVDFRVNIPKEINDKEVKDLKFIPNPSKIVDLRDNSYALYLYRNPKTDIKIIVQGRLEHKLRDLRYAKTHPKNSDTYTQNDLMPARYIEIHEPYIKEIARTIPKGPELSMVKKIFDEVRKRIKYKEQPLEYGALYGLKNGIGDCSEFAYSMAALCRANGIPARVKIGYVVKNGVKSSQIGHAWVEVYFKQYGWVTFDPTGSDFYQLNYSSFYKSTTDIRDELIKNFSVKMTQIGGNVKVFGDIKFY